MSSTWKMAIASSPTHVRTFLVREKQESAPVNKVLVGVVLGQT